MSSETTPFAGLGLSPALLRALSDAGYTTPTPIQAQAIPPALNGRDLLGAAQTGTGKTAAFGLPLLQKLARETPAKGPRKPRALVLVPTRELAVQVADSLKTYGRHLRLNVTMIFGGVGMQPQIDSLRRGVDILVACPGRLLDHLDSGHAKLDAVELLVLDEADRMLDMGFINDVKKIARATHPKRQTALFSATMPNEIEQLARGILKDPVHVEVAPQGTTAAEIHQSVVMARLKQKRDVLSTMLKDDAMSRVIIFARTKHGADRVTRDLVRDGFEAAVIHGNKSQNARQRALNGFRDGEVRILVATDIAARGIDVPNITHVVNFDLPDEAESYVHRIGRTGRNGADGIAITLCDPSEGSKLRQVEKIIRMKLPIAADHLGQADPVQRKSEALPEERENRRPANANGKPRQGRKPGFGQGSGKPAEGQKRPFRAKRRGPSNGGGSRRAA